MPQRIRANVLFDAVGCDKYTNVFNCKGFLYKNINLRNYEDKCNPKRMGVLLIL